MRGVPVPELPQNIVVGVSNGKGIRYLGARKVVELLQAREQDLVLVEAVEGVGRVPKKHLKVI